MLGNWKASRKASDAVPGPRTRARIMSRAKPAMRLTMVRPPIVPVALIRLIAPRARPGSGSGLADDFRGLAAGRFRLELGRALHVKRSEIDRIEPERREAAILNGAVDNLAGEGKKEPGRFGEQERLELLLGDVAKREQACIDQLDLEGGTVVGLGRYLRSEEHTSELQSLMRISYAVFCLK